MGEVLKFVTPGGSLKKNKTQNNCILYKNNLILRPV